MRRYLSNRNKRWRTSHAQEVPSLFLRRSSVSFFLGLRKSIEMDRMRNNDFRNENEDSKRISAHVIHLLEARHDQ